MPTNCRRSTWRATCRTVSTAAPADHVRQAALLLKDAKQVLILAGRASRDPDVWNARVALAEALNARVVTDLKIGATFPTDHPLYVGSPRALTPEERRRVEKRRCGSQPRLGRPRRRAALLRPDRRAPRSFRSRSTIASITAGAWTIRALPPVDLLLSADPDLVVRGTGQGNRQKLKAPCPAEPAQNRRQGDPPVLPTKISHAHCAKCSATARSLTRICRCPGTTVGSHSAIRSTMSAPTAAAASAAVRAFRSARRWRSRVPDGSRSRSAATAIS